MQAEVTGASTVEIVNPQRPEEQSGRSFDVEKFAEGIFREAARTILDRPEPGPSIRLQLQPGFTLVDAAAVVPYLHELGIRTVYLSPLLKSVPGSDHYYNSVRHTHIDPALGGPNALPGENNNPELRGERAFELFTQQLEAHGMSCRFDIVPNHMGVGDRAQQNRWWQSVLQYGADSPCASYFHIDFNKKNGRITTPFIGDTLENVVNDGHLQLKFDDATGKFKIRLYNHTDYPVSPASLKMILGGGEEWPFNTPATGTAEVLDELQTEGLGATPEDIRQLAVEDPAQLFRETVKLAATIGECSHQEPFGDDNGAESRYLPRRVFEIERRVAALAAHSDEFKQFLHARLGEFNGSPGRPETFEKMHGLLDEQVYEFRYWKFAKGHLNVARFFDVNTLWALREENPDVFQSVHAHTFRLIANNPAVVGLRIDHPDGLYDPEGYLHNVQRGIFLAAAQKVFRSMPENERIAPSDGSRITWKEAGRSVVELWEAAKDRPQLQVHIEKILALGESSPKFANSVGVCPYHGTVGYELQAMLRAVSVDQTGVKLGERLYYDLTRERIDFKTARTAAKEMIARHAMADEFDGLSHLFVARFLSDEHGKLLREYRDVHPQSIKHTLETLAVDLAVYRTYVGEHGPSENDRKYLMDAFAAARRARLLPSELYDLVERFFDTREAGITPEEHRNRVDFVGRWQKITGPVTAKAIEDTLFFRYLQTNFALLDVGGDPEFACRTEPADLIDKFHALAQGYQSDFPDNLIAESTHDNKRNAAVAGREVAKSFDMRGYESWVKWLDTLAGKFKEQLAPFDNPGKFAFLVYSTIAGSIPRDFSGLSEAERDEYIVRLAGDDQRLGFMPKALKEAKKEISWISEDDDLIRGSRAFIRSLLTDPECLHHINTYVKQLSRTGARITLAWQTLSNGGLPGIPDLFNGNEIWSYRLVDPDNRGIIDYSTRKKFLASCKKAWGDPERRQELLEAIRRSPDGDQSKMVLTWRGLQIQNTHRKLFREGAYRKVIGRSAPGAEGDASVETLAFLRTTGRECVLTAAHLRDRQNPAGHFLVLPSELDGARFKNEYTGRQVIAHRNELGDVTMPLSEALDGLPGATLLRVA